VTPLATLVEHARLTDLERAMILAIDASPRAGKSDELAELFNVSTRSPASKPRASCSARRRWAAAGPWPSA